MRAKVQHFKPVRVGELRTSARAALPCGCAIYVGLREGNVVGTAAQPCRPEHEPITDRSSGLLREAIARPAPGKLLVDACAKVLTQAAREIG